MRRTVRIIAAALSGVLAISMAACGGGGGAKSESQAEHSDKTANANAQCQNKVKKPNAEKVTVWAWYPAIQKVVDEYNENHDDIQVCWTNAGQGSPEYTKFNNAIKAKSGGPDIIQLEYEAMPQFVAGAQKHLVDLSKYGMNDHKQEYTEGAWKSVSMGGGNSVYGVPVDLGPFVMYVRQDIFDKYHVKVPTTWKEFEQAGKELKAAGFDGFLSDWAPNGTAVNPALFAQAGEKVYKYSSKMPDKVGIKLDTPGVQKVLEYWQNLVKEGLVDTTDANTTDWNNNMISGKYAAYVQASWLTGYIKGLDNSSSGNFRIYKAPVWDDSTPQVNQGGSAWAVTDQAKDTKAAANVAHDLFDSDTAQHIGVTDGALFPSWKKQLASDAFKNMQEPFLGNQKPNEVTIPVANAWKGDEFLPFQTYAYDEQTKSFSAIVKKGNDCEETLKALETKLNNYAKQQGFTIE